MAQTRQPLQPTAYVETHLARPRVVILYDGHPGWKFWFNDLEELAVDLAVAVKYRGLPRCAMDEAMREAKAAIGSYTEDVNRELFPDHDSEPRRCGANHGWRDGPAPVGFSLRNAVDVFLICGVFGAVMLTSGVAIVALVNWVAAWAVGRWGT